jgi:hypothetical protein
VIPSRTASAASSGVGQVSAGVVAHAFASGCLPSASSLALAVPLALFGVILLRRAFSSRPLTALTGGQFAVHAALALSAACAGGHSPHLLMTYAHVAAVVMLRAGWDRVALMLDDAARAAGRRVPRLLLNITPVVPSAEAPVVVDEPDLTPLRLQQMPAPTGRRGPPANTFASTPA